MKVPAVNKRKYKFLPFISLTISMVLMVIGLWPFNFYPGNNVHLTTDRNALRFDRFGLVLIKDPVFGPEGSLNLERPFTILLGFTPHDEPSDSLPRILSAYDACGRELFFLGQWRSELILRILEGERYFHRRYRETGVGRFHKDTYRFVAIRSDSDGLTIFVDGVPAKTKTGFSFSLLSGNRANAWIVLGNSPTGEHPWRGDLYSLTIYPTALSPGEFASPRIDPVVRYPRYDLFIPPVFRAPAKGVLVPPWRVQQYNRSFWTDVCVNILGFIPFGFAMCAWMRKDCELKRPPVTVIVVMLGAGLSLLIELLQVYLPTRDSSLTDVMTNTLGTWAGVSLWQLLAFQKGPIDLPV